MEPTNQPDSTNMARQPPTKLTPNTIKALKPKGTAYRRMDAGYPGFGVQVSPKGKKSFIFRYPAADGRDVPMPLGYYPETSLAEAREKWRHWRAVYDSGRDPKVIRAEELAKEEAERKAAEQVCKQEAMQGSIRQLLDAYVADLKANNKRSWKSVGQCFELNVYHAIPPETKAKDVVPADIREVLAEIIRRDAMVYANRVRAYLSAAFRFGIEWDNDPNRHFEPLRFGISTNPVRDVPKPMKSEKERRRALSDAEVKQVWDCLGYSGFHPKTIAALRLLLALGGQRVEEVLKLHADDVDMQEQFVILRDTKNGRDHLVPFGEVAMPILQAQIDDAGGGLLFGKVKGDHELLMDSSTLSHATAKLCKRIGLEHFQPKDIRRTVKTMMGFAGISKEFRDRFQNHALTDVSSKRYDLYDYLVEKRQVMATWDPFLQSILAGKPETKVVQLRAVGR